MVIMPMFRCAVSERMSKFRSWLKPESGWLKLASTYPSNMKLKSVPHWVNGDFGGVGAGAAVWSPAAGGAGVGAGADCWAKVRPASRVAPARQAASRLFRM